MTPPELIKAIEKRGSKIALTPAELAAKVPVDYATWWRIREGRGNPRWDTMVKLSALHASLAPSKQGQSA